MIQPKIISHLNSLSSASVLFAVFSSIAMPSAFADANRDGNDIEEVYVYSRTAENTFDALAPVSVLTAADIAKLQVQTLGQLLELLPGVDLVSSGSAGSTTSIQTRGSSSDHTLILINGQRFNSATLGSTQFNLVDPNIVERIEFVRGPRSALYGSDAIAGVLLITTKQSVEGSRYVSAEYGSHDLYRASAGFGGYIDQAERLSANLAVSIEDQRGFDSLVDDEGYNADDDGFENGNINFTSRYTRESYALQLQHFQTFSENEYDSSFSPMSEPYAKSKVGVTSAAGNVDISNNLEAIVSIARAVDHSREFNRQALNSGVAQSMFETSRDTAFWQNNWQVSSAYLLTFGADYLNEEVETAEGSELEENERGLTALFAQVQADYGDADVLIGVREDDIDEIGKKVTSSIAAGYTFAENFKVFASWAEGFKMPTFNDLYWPSTAYTAGNRDLLPEASTNREFGVKGRHDVVVWEVSVFNNTVENLIDWAPGADGKWRPSNVAAAKLKGAEGVVGVDLDAWKAELSYSYVDPKDADADEVLQNRAKNKVVMYVEYALQDWRFGSTVKYQDERYIDSENRLAPYTIVNVFASWQLNDQLELGAKVNNALEESYQLNDDYNQDGLNGSVRAKYTF